MLTVVMTTYFPAGSLGDMRASYALDTLQGLMKNLKPYSSIKLHVADDGSDVSKRVFIYKLMYIAHECWEQASTFTDSERGGIGASLNLAMDYVKDEWMYITDDWLLTQQLDLSGPSKLLCSRDYDLVRLGPVHPNLQCLTRFDESIGWWLDIHQHYGGFAFGTRPFIATRTFYEKIGPFDEHLNAYETERLYAERVAQSTARLAYWGGVDLAGPWEHIGNECVGYVDVDNS